MLSYYKFLVLFHTWDRSRAVCLHFIIQNNSLLQSSRQHRHSIHFSVYRRTKRSNLIQVVACRNQSSHHVQLLSLELQCELSSVCEIDLKGIGVSNKRALVHKIYVHACFTCAPPSQQTIPELCSHGGANPADGVSELFTLGHILCGIKCNPAAPIG